MPGSIHDSHAASAHAFQDLLALEMLEDRLAPAILTVNSTLDTANASDPYLSLREAITLVNSATLPSGLSAQITGQIGGTLHAGGNDTIQFDPALVSSPITLSDDFANSFYADALGLTLPGSTAAVTIDGGAAGVTVEGTNEYSVFYVAAGVQATFTHLTITHGQARGYDGGGIENAGTLTVTNSPFLDNATDLGSGGAILNAGTLTVTNSTFSGNSADSSIGSGGGAIENWVSLTVSGCTFTDNEANNTSHELPSSSGGGAISNLGSATPPPATGGRSTSAAMIPCRGCRPTTPSRPATKARIRSPPASRCAPPAPGT